MSDKEDLQVTVDNEGFATLEQAKEPDLLVTDPIQATVMPYVPSAETILIPRKAIPTDQERLADIKKLLVKSQAANVSKSKPFTPIISVARPRVKPEKYERFDDYVARCSGFTPPKEDKASDAQKAEAVKQISVLSKALLKEVDEGRVFHVSDKKTLKQRLQDHVDLAKQKVNKTKSRLFLKIVVKAGKILGIGDVACVEVI